MNRLRERTATLLIAILMISAMVVIIPALGTTIDEGVLTYAAGHYLEGEPLKVGYDIFGYNYQGHMFKGYYCNAYLGRPGSALPPYDGDDAAYFQRLVDEEIADDLDEAEAIALANIYWKYRDVKLAMKWSDLWLSNVDRNDDGKLDRGIGPNYDSSATPGAWETNHQSGKDVVEGETIKWNYFVKIVYPGDDAFLDEGVWYTEEGGPEIGLVLWSSFAVVQRVYNEQGGVHGIEYLSPASPGFGYYEP